MKFSDTAEGAMVRCNDGCRPINTKFDRLEESCRVSIGSLGELKTIQ